MDTKKVTVPALRERKGKGPKITMLTAYDATMARLFDEAGVDALLVGDSLGMVIQGQPNTLSVTIDEICYHGRAVARGSGRAHRVGDMPFMSYQVSVEEAVRNAGHLLRFGAFEAVKVEGGVEIAEAVRRMVAAGIPVMGHVGLTPQSVHAMGGFRVQGRTDDGAERILADARALEQAGAYAVVLEGIPTAVAERVTAAIGIPTIGIGAGNVCDGQVLVGQDMLGMVRDMKPRFVKNFAPLGDAIVEATRAYCDEVQTGVFPGPEHSFGSGPAAPALAAPKPAALPAADAAGATSGRPGYGPSGD
ncbi:MAG: 3-methyl-2-oxobutanoate hydroxymethyltransferase [Myxococcales bacterium]|nr:MAG: 3-methyl-2-oxobutanoate hydroxymethyltransferase [Myxococcales bacterium]